MAGFRTRFLKRAPELDDLHSLDYVLDAEVLPRRGCPIDIDALAEVNGHFLVLELKRPGEVLSVGQRTALWHLADVQHAIPGVGPAFRVFVVTGPLAPTAEDVLRVEHLGPGQSGLTYEAMPLACWVWTLKTWATFADFGGYPVPSGPNLMGRGLVVAALPIGPAVNPALPLR